MKQTAVEKMIEYFIEQKNNGVSHWCINDLIGQLYQVKAMEKEIIQLAYLDGRDNEYATSKDYYNEVFKS